MKRTTTRAIMLVPYIIITSFLPSVLLADTCTNNVADTCTNNVKCCCRKEDWMFVSADCANKSIEIMPNFTDNVNSIDLSHNLLTVINTTGFPLLLRILDLSYNNINNLSNGSFLDVPYLEELNLANNNLSYTFPRNVFQRLANLKVLYLQNNAISYQDLYPYPSKLFLNLLLLETLNIDGLRNGTFDKHTFPSNNTHIRSLNVSGLNGKCFITHLQKGFFSKNFNNLSTIDLSGCLIKFIEEGVFKHLNKLSFLDISYNEALTFNAFPNLTSDFQLLKQLETFHANKIHCTFGLGTYLQYNHTLKFRNTTIKNISLSSNRLELIDDGAIYNFPPNLTYLNVADNKLTFGWYILETSHMNELKVIDLSNQFLTHFKTNFLQHCDENQLVCVQPVLKHIFPATLSGMSSASKMNLTFYLPANLEIMNLQGSALNMEIKNFNFSPNNSLKVLNAQNNFLENLTGPILGLHRLETLNISDNFISFMAEDFLLDVPNLKILDLSNNLLGFCLNKLFPFDRLNSLKTLIISNNRIEKLPTNIFRNISSIEKIDMSSNVLRNFTLSFKGLSLLKELDISSCQISVISRDTITSLESIQNTNPLKIHFKDNPILCSCESLFTLKWIYSSKIDFVEKNNYICRFKNSTEIRLHDLHLIIKRIEKECSSYEELILVLTACIIFAFAVTICGIIYRYRWKLRYYYYMSKWSCFGSPSHSDRCYKRLYEYDAFVSYADEENVFVKEEMVQNLENVAGFHLCIHGRDFTPGKSIPENITYAIHNSRKIICIISENFVSSHWCMYELEMARTDSIYSRRGEESLMLVLFNGVPTNTSKIAQSMRIMSIINQKCCIEYPQEDDREIFWNTLKEVISND